jgi:hypothetical protein
MKNKTVKLFKTIIERYKMMTQIRAVLDTGALLVENEYESSLL